MQNIPGPELKREIGATGLALNAMNLTIGSGIFVLPAVVALGIGRAGFIAYLACGFLAILITLCYAEVGSKITSSGGSYAYVEKAFGPLPGFFVNTLAWFGFSALADGAVVNAMTDMLSTWFPVLNIHYVRVAFFVVLFSSLALVNIRGAKQGSGFASIATLLKLLPIVLLIIFGMFHIASSNLAITTWPPIKSMGEASLSLFFAFVGFETALGVSGEIKNPKKNIPKGIMMAVAGVLVIYISLQFVAQGVLGDRLSAPENAKAPLSALATSLVGTIGGTIILITGIVSMFGLLSGDMLASPRLLFAAAEDKLLPKFLSRIHPKFSTPYWSIIVYCIVATILASSGGFKQLAVLASSSILLVYLGVAAATIVLRYKKGFAAAGSFKIPGGLVIPLLAIITIAIFLYFIKMNEVKALAIFFSVLTILYYLKKLVDKRATPLMPALEEPGDTLI
jgi:APA family basic amino acid/polyamine antiporter